MKRDILKFKLAMLATAAILSNHSKLVSMSPAQATADILVLDENQFLEQMVFRIKDSVKDIITYVDSFVTPNQESFTAYIQRGKTKLANLENIALKPTKQKLDLVATNQPGSPFHLILEKAYKIGSELHQKLKLLIDALEAHKKSADAKKATHLLNKLKPIGMALTAPEKLDALIQQVTEIHNLMLPNTKLQSVAQEVSNLIALLKELKVTAAANQNKVNLSILGIVEAMLKRG